MAKLVSARTFRHYALGLPASDSLAEFLSVTLHITGSVFLAASSLPGLAVMSHLSGRGASLSLLASVCLLASTGWDVLAALAAHALSYTQLPAADRSGGGVDTPGGHFVVGAVDQEDGAGGTTGRPARGQGGDGDPVSHAAPGRTARTHALRDGVIAAGTFAASVTRLNATLLLWLSGDDTSAAAVAGRRHASWAAGLGVATLLLGLPLAVSPWEAGGVGSGGGGGGGSAPPGGWARAHRSAMGVVAALTASGVVELVARLRQAAPEANAGINGESAAFGDGSGDTGWLLLASYVLLVGGAVANQARVAELPSDGWWPLAGGGGGGSGDVEAWGALPLAGGSKAARLASTDDAAPAEALWVSGRDGGGRRDGQELSGRRGRSGRDREGGRAARDAVDAAELDAYVGGAEERTRSKKYRRERRR